MSDTTFDTLNQERTELIREITLAVVTQILPKVQQQVSSDLVSEITSIVNRRFDELDKTSEERHATLVKQTEARFALTATKEELSGVVRSGAENTERIARLEARAEVQDKRLQQIEGAQQQQYKSIDEIKNHSDVTAKNAMAIRSTMDELIRRDEKRQAEIDRQFQDQERDLAAVKDNQAADKKVLESVRVTMETRLMETKQDVLNVRGDVDGLRGDIATKVTTTDLKVKSIDLQMVDMKQQIDTQIAEVKQHQTNHQKQLLDLSGSFAQFQIQLKSAMWLLNTVPGRMILTAIVVFLGITK